MHSSRFRQPVPKIKLQQQAVWFLYIVVMTFSMAVGLLTQLYHQIMERQAVEFERKKAELALYKAQINPHFLFNSLNTLYAMVLTGSAQVEDAFTQFIGLMKYMYANNTKDKIPVCTEGIISVSISDSRNIGYRGISRYISRTIMMKQTRWELFR